MQLWFVDPNSVFDSVNHQLITQGVLHFKIVGPLLS